MPGFTYIRPLGSGGFADVFLYEQDMPRRIVAVKVLVDDAINPDVLRTFNAEADILARLSTHPTIVTIYQASISADGRPYFAMEYCPETMSSRYKKAPLSIPEVLATGVRIASALESAHRSGVLHRDIKPSNILLTTMGLPVLADFGIASALLRADDSPEVFAMSVPWSSPEVVQEATTGTVASEVWSLGATLYTLVAGRAPFDSTDGSKKPREKLVKDIVSAPCPSIGRPDAPARLDAALARAMEKTPAKRFTTMLEFAEELRWIQYEVGVAPTALEVASQEWASASGTFDGSDASARGPVISTVREQSRRAARAQELASLDRRRHQSPQEASATPSSKKSALIGAIAGAASVTVITLVALAVAGVI